jgi:hypothetical protein
VTFGGKASIVRPDPVNSLANRSTIYALVALGASRPEVQPG